MMFTPSCLLFTLVLTLSLMVVVSSPSWLGAWLGLEINLMSFIPLMLSRAMLTSVESCIKYFLVQAFSSLLFLMSVLMMISYANFMWFTKIPVLLLLITSLLIKLGAAPFHFWFPAVSSGIGWYQNFVLMTVQKFAPLVLLSYVWGVSPMGLGVIMCSAGIGAVGGLNQSSLRKLMAYSSINHLAWLLLGLHYGMDFMLIYFMIYLVTNGLLVAHLSSKGCFYLSQMYYHAGPGFDSLVMSMNWLSFGGLPPFIGFFGKWMLISLMLSSGLVTISLFMVFMSLLSLYYYSRVCYSVFSQSGVRAFISHGGASKWAIYFYMGLVLLGLAFVPMFVMML